MQWTSLLFACLFAIASPARAQSPFVRPIPFPATALEIESMVSSERWQEIKRLERELDSDASQALEIHVRLAAQYAALDNADTRRLALEHLREARELDPAAQELVLAEARILERQRYYLPAVNTLLHFAKDHGATAEVNEALGYLRFVDGIRTLDWKDLERSRSAYVRAVKTEGADDRVYRSLAAVAVAMGHSKTEVISTKYLLERHADDPGACLLAAVAAIEEQNGLISAQLLDRVLPYFAERERAFAASGQPLLEDSPGRPIDDAEGYWQALNPHPTWTVNQRHLRFLRRWIEAEILFGVGDFSEPVWQKPLGEMWLRFGRPDALRFIPAELWDPTPAVAKNVQALSLEPFSDLGEPAGEEPIPLPNWDTFFSTREDRDRRNHLLAVGYNLGDEWLSLLFRDGSYNLDWKLTSNAGHTLQKTLRRAPIYFRETAAATQLLTQMATAGYHRSDGSVRLELHLAVDGFERESGVPPVVSWYLSTDAGEPLDRGERKLEGSNDLSHLLEAIDRAPLRGNARLAQLSWLIPPGAYRLAVEAIDPSSGATVTRQMEVALMSAGRDPLLVSDLMLAESFVQYDPQSGVPLEFVKHANVVIPNFRVMKEDRSEPLYVYYEVLGLGLDATGRTHFDVRYEIESGDVATDTVVATTSASPSSERSTFLEERTGISPGGLVVKGSALDVAGLPLGKHALLVSIHDRVLDRWAGSRLEFEVVE